VRIGGQLAQNVVQ